MGRGEGVLASACSAVCLQYLQYVCLQYLKSFCSVCVCASFLVSLKVLASTLFSVESRLMPRGVRLSDAVRPPLVLAPAALPRFFLRERRNRCVLLPSTHARGRETTRPCKAINFLSIFSCVLTRLRACSIVVAAPRCFFLYCVQDRVAVIATAPLTTNEVSACQIDSSGLEICRYELRLISCVLRRNECRKLCDVQRSALRWQQPMQPTLPVATLIVDRNASYDIRVS